MANARARQAKAWVYFAGNSMSTIPSERPYPAYLMGTRDLPWFNAAQSGKSWTELIATIGTDLSPALAYGVATKRVVILCGGLKDVNDGDTGAQIHADMVSYADLARTAGASHVIATTILPSSTFTAGEDTERAAANTLLLADTADDFDGVADLAGTAGLNDHTNGTYYIEGTHWWPAGAYLAATVVAPVLDTVLAL